MSYQDGQRSKEVTASLETIPASKEPPSLVGGLVCRNCLNELPLPAAKMGGLPGRIPCWPGDGEQRHFLCLRCKFVYAYSPESIFAVSECRRRSNSQTSDAVVCIETACTQSDCRYSVRVHALMQRRPDPFVRLLELRSQIATADAIRCEQGHEQCLLNWNEPIGFDAYFDPFWTEYDQCTRTEETAYRPPSFIFDPVQQFVSEERCMAYLDQLRWPTKVPCPSCGSERTSVTTRKRKSKNKRRLYLRQCLSCKRQFTAVTDTIFHRSHIPLTQWFAALAVLLNSPATSVGVLKKQLNVVTYKTAHYLVDRLLHSTDPLNGRFRASESRVPERNHIKGKKDADGNAHLPTLVRKEAFDAGLEAMLRTHPLSSPISLQAANE
jgi:transposase-like protein